MRIIRSSGGREYVPARFFVEFFIRSDTQCLTPSGMMVHMKSYSTRHRRRTLLPVPYSVRPDRLERGIRMLRALRLSLAAQASATRAQQYEFPFAMAPQR
jgi:hypothetical protein